MSGTISELANQFSALHRSGKPLILHNVWDVGSALAVAKGGTPAVATGSAGVAAAQGFEDGEAYPLREVWRTAQRICDAVEVPVSVDFEGGYGATPAEVSANVAPLIAAGAVGINFEDGVIGGSGLYSVDEQVSRIKAIRELADAQGLPLFINARCDLFIQAGSGQDHRTLLPEALGRAAAYVEAGATGIFLPFLTDLALIEAGVAGCEAPLNVMQMPDGPDVMALAEIGVARVSHGPFVHRELMEILRRKVGSTQEL